MIIEEIFLRITQFSKTRLLHLASNQINLPGLDLSDVQKINLITWICSSYMVVQQSNLLVIDLQSEEIEKSAVKSP